MKAENYINIINELNEQIDYKSERYGYPKFYYETDGYIDSIMFGEVCLYDNENYSSMNSEDELKEFIIDEFKKYRKYVKGIKF